MAIEMPAAEAAPKRRLKETRAESLAIGWPAANHQEPGMAVRRHNEALALDDDAFEAWRRQKTKQLVGSTTAPRSFVRGPSGLWSIPAPSSQRKPPEHPRPVYPEVARATAASGAPPNQNFWV
jgi:hypothetical protein